MSTKLSFSLKSNKSSKTAASSKATKKETLDNFEDLHEKEQKQDELVHPDLKEPLVIPVQKDSRQSLQEQARAKREQQEPEKLSKEDQEAIAALKQEAAGDSLTNSSSGNNRVIQVQENTFQSVDQREDEQLKEDLEQLAPDLSVDSETYQKVPIADFGAALLRGMGWTGSVDKSDTANNLPRPSRLGLGATPKLLDAPTHKKGRRRQDQVQREKQLKEQQEEFEKERQLQIKNDKQQTIQVGSIVSAEEGRRAIIRQWNGVPGLNMILVQFEGNEKPTKVKKGSVQLVDREELQKRPFEEPVYRKPEVEYTEQKHENESRGRKEDDDRHEGRTNRHRDDEDERRERRRDHSDRRSREKRGHDEEDPRRRRSDERQSRRHEQDRDRRGSRDRDNVELGERRSDDIDRHGRKRARYQAPEQRLPTTWLTPSIRVRVITSKYGRSHDKKKGVVVDVATKGATLKMENGDILQVPERYLETALPKVGGNAIILTGKNRFAKGKLIERDSRANKGAVQLFEDMNIVNTSLDDMAEWCLALDDDLME